MCLNTLIGEKMESNNYHTIHVTDAAVIFYFIYLSFFFVFYTAAYLIFELFDLQNIKTNTKSTKETDTIKVYCPSKSQSMWNE